MDLMTESKTGLPKGTRVRIIHRDPVVEGTVIAYNSRTTKYKISVPVGPRGGRTKTVLAFRHSVQVVCKKWSSRHDDKCVACKRHGLLMLCEYCNVVIHPQCLKSPRQKPLDGEWICDSCCQNRYDRGTYRDVFGWHRT